MEFMDEFIRSLNRQELRELNAGLLMACSEGDDYPIIVKLQQAVEAHYIKLYKTHPNSWSEWR